MFQSYIQVARAKMIAGELCVMIISGRAGPLVVSVVFAEKSNVRRVVCVGVHAMIAGTVAAVAQARQAIANHNAVVLQNRTASVSFATHRAIVEIVKNVMIKKTA